jgi:hypothetical protein
MPHCNPAAGVEWGVAIVFVLALLLDSACTTACISAELDAPAEHCASPDGGRHGEAERSCDLHGHLKPVVKDRNLVPSTTIADRSAPPDAPVTAAGVDSFYAAAVREVALYLPPPLQRSSVLRI